MMNTRTALTLVALFLLAITLAACNTIEGAGKDISAAGEGISGAAEDTSDAIDGDN